MLVVCSSSLRSTLLVTCCRLSSLPAWLADGLPGLTCLDVSGNSLSALPESLPSSLVTLSASSNALTALPSCLMGLSGLAELELGDNDLGPFLPGMLWGFTKLQSLGLAANGIAHLPHAISQLQKLRCVLHCGYPLLGCMPCSIMTHACMCALPDCYLY